MHPVRPGGTLTTDSSSPSRFFPHFGQRSAWRTSASAHCGWVATGRMDLPDAAKRPSSPPKIDPDDGRSIRPPGQPLAYPRKRPAALARRKPPKPSFFQKGPKRVFQGTFRSFTPSPVKVKTPLTRRCSFASVIDAKRKSRNRCFRPRSTRNWTLAGNAANAILMRAARTSP